MQELHKTYVTFGFDHIHNIDGQIIDKDCVAVIESLDAQRGRERAFELFGRRFSMEYPEKYFDHSKMYYYPRGFVNLR